MSRKAVVSDVLRIANQYRRRPTGMVCELRVGDAKLAVHVWQPDGPSSSNWCVEAHGKSGEEVVVMGRSAGTRAEALRDVGAAWAAERINPSFDWDGIAKLLESVRVV